MFLLSAYPITTALSKAQYGKILKATKTCPSWVLAFLNFDYGSGGTTIDVLIQTSWDGGASFWDFIYFTQITTSDKVQSYLANGPKALVPTATSFITPAVGSLSAGNAILTAPGTMFQAVLTTAGTYAGDTALTVGLIADVPLSIANGAES